MQHRPAFVAERRAAEDSGERAPDDPDTGARGCCGCGPRKTGDGRTWLMRLLYWDMFAFAVSVAFLAMASVSLRGGVQTSHWQFQSNLYWTTVLYSMLTFPFFPFQLPVLNKMLTHAENTGYNANGQCVPFKLNTTSNKLTPAPAGAPFAVDGQDMEGRVPLAVDPVVSEPSGDLEAPGRDSDFDSEPVRAEDASPSNLEREKVQAWA